MNRSALLGDHNTTSTSLMRDLPPPPVTLPPGRNGIKNTTTNNNSKRLGLLGSPLKQLKRRTNGTTNSSQVSAAPPEQPEREDPAAKVKDDDAEQKQSVVPKLPTKKVSRVLDFQVAEDEDEEEDDAQLNHHQRREIFRGLEEDPDNSLSSAAAAATTTKTAPPTPAPVVATAVAPARRSRQYFSKLPTLDETSSSESDNGFEDDDKDNAAMLTNVMFQESSANITTTGASPKRKLLELRAVANSQASLSSKQPLSVSNTSMSSSLTSSSSTSTSSTTVTDSTSSSINNNATNNNNNKRRTNKTFQERVQKLTEQGDALASCGKEEEALVAYKKALKVNRIETTRIKCQLKQVDGKHPSTVHSIVSRLYEDWLLVGTNIAQLRCKMAVLSERVGDYDRALSCCQEAKGVYKRQLSFLERKKLDTSDVKVKAKAVSKMYDKMVLAHKSFNNRKKLHEEIIVFRRALQLEQRDRSKLYTRLEELSQKALAVETEMLGRDHPQVADTLSILATLAMEQGKTGRAERYLKEAIQITQIALGSQHPLTGEILLQMARVKASQPQIDVPTTVQYYQDALTIFRAVNAPLVTPTLNEMSVLQIRQRDYAISIELLKEALEADQAHDSGVIVQIYRNLGECYSHLRDYPSASEAFVKALDKQREIRHQYESANEEVSPLCMPLMDDESLADTVRRLGKAYMGCGKHVEALAMFGEALLIHRAAVLKAVNPVGGKPHDGLPVRQDQLAHTLFCIAEAREVLGELSEAERVYSESMQLRLFSDAHRADKRQNMIHCAMCLRGIGNIHLSRREYEAAKRVFDDALRYCEGHGIPNDHPIASSIRQKLDEAVRRSDHETRVQELHQLEQEAKVQIASGDLDQAVDTLTRLMATRKAILKLLKASNQDATNEKIETAYTLKLFGKVLLKKGDAANAERALGDSLKLFKKGDDKDQAAIEEVKLLLENLRTAQVD